MSTINPIEFFCLTEFMDAKRVRLQMSVSTYQAIISRLGSITNPSTIPSQPAINGLDIEYDATYPTGKVTFHTRYTPYTKAYIDLQVE